MLTIKPIVDINLVVNKVEETKVDYDIGLILGTTSGTGVATERMKKYKNLEEMAADSFANTSAEYKAAAMYFGQTPKPEAVYVGYWNKGSGQAETVVDALITCDEVGGDYWGVYVCGITNTEIEEVEAYFDEQDNHFLFYEFTGTYAAATAANSPFVNLNKKSSRRAAGLFNETVGSACAWMGRVCGLNRYYKDSSFTACYKDLKLVPTTTLTASQVEALEEINANVYVTRGYRYDVLEHASTGFGLRVDEMLYIDILKTRVRDACLNLMFNSERLPQNDATSAMFINAITGVINEFRNRGIIDSGIWYGNDIGNLRNGDTMTGGYYLYVDSYSNQSQTDREAHKAMPMQLCIHFAGSVESIVIDIDVQR